MILLALDTCDACGSVAVVRDGEVISLECHGQQGEYSSWLIPASERSLRAAGLSPSQVEVYAVASGPGSFTGLRVGLTTVKAWSEVYRKPIIAVSRLEAVATQAVGRSGLVAAVIDAHRGQFFGALYKMQGGNLCRIQDEMVVSPENFVDWVQEQAGSAAVVWATLDSAVLDRVQAWKRRMLAGDAVQAVSPVLSPVLARLAAAQFRARRVTDALHLDANYVRRSDAEIFWKGDVNLASRI